MDEPARRIRGNVAPGGRYGTADDRLHHMEPEVPPLGVESAPVRLPEGLPGALPENEGREGTEERQVVRLPEATAKALEEDEG